MSTSFDAADRPRPKAPPRTGRWRRAALAGLAALAACLTVVAAPTAAPAGAAPCQTCPDDPPPPPGPSPAPRLTYTVEMGVIHAYETEDYGNDEVELLLNGEYIFTRSMSNGMELPINRVRNVHGTFNLILYDEDGPFDNDDHLGTVTFNPATTGGAQLAYFTEDGAFYVVTLWISPPFWA